MLCRFNVFILNQKANHSTYRLNVIISKGGHLHITKFHQTATVDLKKGFYGDQIEVLNF